MQRLINKLFGGTEAAQTAEIDPNELILQIIKSGLIHQKEGIRGLEEAYRARDRAREKEITDLKLKNMFFEAENKRLKERLLEAENHQNQPEIELEEAESIETLDNDLLIPKLKLDISLLKAENKNLKNYTKELTRRNEVLKTESRDSAHTIKLLYDLNKELTNQQLAKSKITVQELKTIIQGVSDNLEPESQQLPAYQHLSKSIQVEVKEEEPKTDENQENDENPKTDVNDISLRILPTKEYIDPLAGNVGRTVVKFANKESFMMVLRSMKLIAIKNGKKVYDKTFNTSKTIQSNSRPS